MVSKPVTLIVTGLLALGTTSIRAQSDSESERLEKLERAVEQLQKRNAELENEVQSLKKADCVRAGSRRQWQSKTKDGFGRKDVAREAGCYRRKTAGVRCAARTGDQAYARWIYSSEFRRRRCLRV